MQNYSLKVLAIRQETSNTVTVCFKQPGLKKIRYIAGQYLTLIFRINGRRYLRPYSFSSAPVIESSLNVTVKRVPGGIVSNHIIDQLKVDDIVEVMPPMGNFVYQENNYENEVFLWAAGSGITPLMAILKTALKTSSQPISLYYCNKSLRQTIFYQELCVLHQQYPERFSLNIFCTNEKNDNTKFGRIGADDVYDSLKVNEKINNAIHYICGPNGLKESVKTGLTKLGISKDQVFSEDFEHSVSEDELKDVITQFVEITKGQEKNHLEVVRGKSILEAALDSGMDLPYSCQTGSCTLCKATITMGEVKTIGHEKPDYELTSSERLLCCSYPLTDNIKLKIE